MAELRIGLVGFGRFARLHARAYATIPGCRITAVCDHDPVALHAAAELAPGAERYDDLARMLDAGSLDAVDIVTDETAHGAQALACLERDLPVLVEKPLATTGPEARAIGELASARGLPALVGYVSRFDHRYAFVRAAVADGRLGDVVSVSARRSFSRAWFASFGDRVHPVFESMIHDIDLAQWYLDAPVRSVYARTLAAAAADGIEAPDVLAALLTAEDGRIATLQSTWLTPGAAPQNLPGAPLDPLDLEGTIDAQLDVSGTRGTARVTLDDGPRVWTDERAVSSAGLWPVVHGQLGGALREELAHFVACATERRPSTIVPLSQSVESVEIAEAIIRSAASGEPVAL